MDVKSRSESYHKWKDGELSVMVATSAFGMDIDKSNVKRHNQIRSSRKHVQLGTGIKQGWKRRGEYYHNHLLFDL